MLRGHCWPWIPNGYEVPAEAEYTREKLINDILGKEVPGGGWSMNDTEPEHWKWILQSMVVYALAPHASENPDVQATLDRALKVLRDEISEDGDYASGSDYNCESAGAGNHRAHLDGDRPGNSDQCIQWEKSCWMV